MSKKDDRNILKNSTMLFFMNVAKMVFPLLTLPYLTRVLTKDCYGTVVYVNDAILDGRDGMCVQSNGKKEYSIIVDSSFLDERIPDTELREIVMRQLLFTVDAPGESLAFWIRAVNSIKYKLNVNIDFRKILEEEKYVNRN